MIISRFRFASVLRERVVSMGKLMTQTLGGNAFFVHPKPVVSKGMLPLY
jgi:hypothetical protein